MIHKCCSKLVLLKILIHERYSNWPTSVTQILIRKRYSKLVIHKCYSKLRYSKLHKISFKLPHKRYSNWPFIIIIIIIIILIVIIINPQTLLKLIHRCYSKLLSFELTHKRYSKINPQVLLKLTIYYYCYYYYYWPTNVTQSNPQVLLKLTIYYYYYY